MYGLFVSRISPDTELIIRFVVCDGHMKICRIMDIDPGQLTRVYTVQTNILHINITRLRKKCFIKALLYLDFFLMSCI